MGESSLSDVFDLVEQAAAEPRYRLNNGRWCIRPAAMQRGVPRVWYVQPATRFKWGRTADGGAGSPGTRGGWYIKQPGHPDRVSRFCAAARLLQQQEAAAAIHGPVVAGVDARRGMMATWPVAGQPVTAWLRCLMRWPGRWRSACRELSVLADRLGRGFEVLWGAAAPSLDCGRDYTPAETAARMQRKWRRLRDAMAGRLDSFEPALHRVIERLAARPCRTGLVLGDAAPGHLLLNEHGLCPVDLDDVGIGDPVRDAACLLEHIEAASASPWASARRARSLCSMLCEHWGIDVDDPAISQYRTEFAIDRIWSALKIDSDLAVPNHGRSVRRSVAALNTMLDRAER